MYKQTIETCKRASVEEELSCYKNGNCIFVPGYCTFTAVEERYICTGCALLLASFLLFLFLVLKS